MRTLLIGTLALLLCCSLSAEEKKDEKIDAKKLVGQWEPKEKTEGRTMVFEYTKDGKLTLTTTEGKKESKLEGTYKVDGNKITTTAKVGDKELSQTRTIAKLTDTELVIADEKGRGNTFVRIKDK